MKDEARMRALVPCYIHKGLFFADIELVNTLRINPETRLPIELNPDLSPREYTQEEKARTIQVDICAPCMDEVNKKRLRKGLDPIAIFDSAEHQGLA